MKKIMVIASAMLFGFMNAHALTTAGEQIQNTVTLSYTVDSGGTPVTQTDIVANDGDGFLVDRKIDVLVSETDATQTVDVVPGATDQLLQFTIANQGNDEETFDLTPDITTIAGDQFDPDTCAIYLASDTAFATPITSVPVTQENTEDVVIKCNIPTEFPAGTVLSNGDQAIVSLTAAIDPTVRPEDTDGDAEDTVENVYADAAGTDDSANNGDHSDRGTYNIVSAEVSASKSSCIVSDPVNASNNPKRIPGAVIRYSIEITNSGTVDADNVSITDDLSSEYGTTAANLDVRTAACAGIDAGTNACAVKTGTAETNAGTTGSGTASVTLDYDTVAAGVTECGYFEVTIQ